MSLHQMQDIQDYLSKYPFVIDGIVILDWSFLVMEVLKPVLSTITLLVNNTTGHFNLYW